MDALFTDDDRRRIADAVAAAEAKTSGEIVPYVVLRSAPYAAVPWRGGVLGMLIGLAVLVLARALVPDALPWLASDGPALFVALGTGALGAGLAASVPPLTRRFAGADRMADAVHRRAMQAFVEEEVFATRARTGILLFVSLLEHRIEVLADAGIHQQVNDEAWDDVTAQMRRGIESGQLAQGLVDAIEACGALLDRHGVTPQPDDTDELSGHLRLCDE